MQIKRRSELLQMTLAFPLLITKEIIILYERLRLKFHHTCVNNCNTMHLNSSCSVLRFLNLISFSFCLKIFSETFSVICSSVRINPHGSSGTVLRKSLSYFFSPSFSLTLSPKNPVTLCFLFVELFSDFNFILFWIFSNWLLCNFRYHHRSFNEKKIGGFSKDQVRFFNINLILILS